MAGHSEKPECSAKTERSRAYSPIATPTWGEDEAGVVIIPKGMLAREKWESAGISSQDLDAIALTLNRPRAVSSQTTSLGKLGDLEVVQSSRQVFCIYSVVHAMSAPTQTYACATSNENYSNHQRSGRFQIRSKRLPRLAEYLPKATSEEVMIGLCTLLKRDIQLSKHDRNENASTCAGNEVDMTRSHTVTSSDHVFHVILSHLVLGRPPPLEELPCSDVKPNVY